MIRNFKWRYKNDREFRVRYKRAYRRKNREKLNAQAREYQKKNRKKGNAAMQRWRNKNREHVRSYQNAYRLKNVEHYRAKSKRLYWANRKQRLLAHRKWREANPGWHRDYVAKNRERIRAWYREWAKANKNVKEKQVIGQKIRYGALDGGWLHSKWLKTGKLCYICGKALRRYDISIDHVFPASKGGSHAQLNLMPVHRRCNCKKANKVDFPVVSPDLIRKAA